jgi:hypothetical protein
MVRRSGRHSREPVSEARRRPYRTRADVQDQECRASAPMCPPASGMSRGSLERRCPSCGCRLLRPNDRLAVGGGDAHPSRAGRVSAASMRIGLRGLHSMADVSPARAVKIAANALAMVRSWSRGSPRTMSPPTAPEPKLSPETWIPVRWICVSATVYWANSPAFAQRAWVVEGDTHYPGRPFSLCPAL